MEEIVYLNGTFMPPQDARVSVLDRGFLLGDGVYEVVPAYGGRLFRLPEHLARLRYSLECIKLPNPHDEAHWSALLHEVVRRNPWSDQTVYLQITRGVARREHTFPDPPVPPTVLIMSSALKGPSDAERTEGVRVITREDYRWLRCDIKTISLLANCLLRQEAAEAGCAEVILLREGKVTEGSASNVYIVKDGIVIAPPKDNLILPGVTYDLVFELAKAAGLPFEFRPISLAELYVADEVWLSSSIREVLPVVQVDGMPIGGGRPGPVQARMYGLYQDYKTRVAQHD